MKKKAFAVILMSCALSGLYAGCGEDSSFSPDLTDENGSQKTDKPDKTDKPEKNGCMDSSTYICDNNTLYTCRDGKQIPAANICANDVFEGCRSGKYVKRVCSSCGQIDGVTACLDCASSDDCGKGTCEDGVCTGDSISCLDACDPVGVRECSGNGYRECLQIGDCKVWSDIHLCRSGEKCQSGACEMDTGAPCTNACESGKRQCAGTTGYTICSDTNGDGCFEWGATVPCNGGSICENGLCVSSEISDCELGARRCDGAAKFQVCGDSGNGVYKWGTPESCGSGMRCTGAGVCGPEPETCTSACQNGEKQCSGSGYQVCSDANGDGCFEWSAVTSCGSGKKCEGAGNCVSSCTSVCNNGTKQCSGNGFQVCVDTNGDGCFEWTSVTSCPGGQKCEGEGNCVTSNVNAPVRYLATNIHSPVTAYTVAQWKKIAQNNTSRNNNSFIKLGDSHMYSGSMFMKCFADSVNYDSHTNIKDAVSAFQSNGFNSFTRDSIAAKLGMTATYPLQEYNSTTRMDAEIAAGNPRFAFFGFATNDMGWYGYNKTQSGSNAGYFAAMEWYYRNVLKNVRKLVAAGVIPMFIGVSPRTDTPASGANKPGYYVTTMNTIMRGVAEAYQMPYFNLQKVFLTLPSYGLGGDGIHSNSYGNGCDFTSTGLQKGANNRNLYAMEMLNRAWRAYTKGESAPDTSGEVFKGSGSPSDPFVITSLPYTHSADMSKSPNSKISSYSCESGTSEAGPE